MENLIKSILEQLSIVVDKRSKAQPFELLKTLPNGQWELLNKADEVPSVKPSASPNVHNEMFTHLFGHMSNITNHLNSVNKSPTTGGSKKLSNNARVNIPHSPSMQVLLDHQEEATGHRPQLHNIKTTRGAIKDYALKLPKGQIDLAHVGKLRESLPKLNDKTWAQRPMSHEDMAEIINHHFGDAPSLKHIYDHGGGVGAIETLARTMGANGMPKAYSSLKFKNPQLHHDLLHLVNPSKQSWENQHGPHIDDPKLSEMQTQLHRNRWSGADTHDLEQQIAARQEHLTNENPPIKSTYEDTLADQKYDDAIDAINTSGGEFDENANQWVDLPEDVHQQNLKDLDNAAAARAVHRFMKHHKLY
jgi:hypothetical protein